MCVFFSSFFCSGGFHLCYAPSPLLSFVSLSPSSVHYLAFVSSSGGCPPPPLCVFLLIFFALVVSLCVLHLLSFVLEKDFIILDTGHKYCSSTVHYLAYVSFVHFSLEVVASSFLLYVITSVIQTYFALNNKSIS
jgi:hypothetical protein